jgi:4-amino-4-deoxy-L-arabinose transferase-like glycosyltransferase
VRGNHTTRPGANQLRSERTTRVIPYLLLAAAVVIVVTGVIKAAWMPLWNDEIFTVIAAELPQVSDIWRYLADGADVQPPLYFVLIRGSIRLLGSDALGARIPSLIAYVLFCGCMYRVTARLTNKWYGLVAFLLPSVTQCWYYATEGRPYALLMGFTGMAMVCWQAAIRNERRGLALAGLTVCLACAFNTHYYGPLIVIPFAIAEAVRVARRRMLDWPIYVAVAIATSSIALWLRVAMTARAHSGVHWEQPALIGSLVETASYFLAPGIIALIGIGAIIIGTQWWPTAANETTDGGALAPRFDADIALIVSMALLPAVGVVFAKLVTHAYVPRYFISAMGGFCVLASLALFIALRGSWRAGGAAAAVVFGAFALVAQWDVRAALAARRQPMGEEILGQIPRAALADTLPIVFTNHHDFMQLFYYGDRALINRTYMLIDPDCSLRIGGANQAELALAAAARYAPLQIMTYRNFARQHSSFYLLAQVPWDRCTTKQLLEDGAHLSMIGGGHVFRVNMPPVSQ